MSAISSEYEQDQANAICYSTWREHHKTNKSGKIDKDEADYIARALGSDRCGLCTMFQPPDACTLVEGEISADGHCRYFEEKVQKAAILNDGRKRFYAPIQKVEDQPDGTIRVYGIASTEDQDDQGEIILADAMRKAIPDYMRFGAIREMHQLAAAGTALGCQVGEDGVTRLEGHVVDPVAVLKVKSKVYKGFSVGGKVTSRVAGDPKKIDGVTLEEISLVDRPANPAALMEMWKAGATPMPDGGLGTLGDTEAGKKLAALAVAPVQIWACGDPAHQHAKKDEAAACMAKRAAEPPKPEPEPEPVAPSPAQQAATAIDAGLAALTRATETTRKASDKPYGDVEYADPGYQSDGKKRYPVDTEKHVRAAWSYINKPANAKKYSSEQLSHIKGKIKAAAKKFGVEISDDSEKASIPEMQKALTDAGRVASIIMELNWLQDALEMERAMEGDESENPGKLEQIVKDLCGFLVALVTEETGEIIEGTETGHPGMYGPFGYAATPETRKGLDALLSVLGKAGTLKGNRLVSELSKARSAHHQHLLDLAMHATKAAGEVADGEEDKTHLGIAADHLREAGAGEYGPADIHSTTDTANNPTHPAPTTGGGDPTGKAAIVDMLKRAGDHKPLVNIAHECVKAITAGEVCKASGAEMAHLHAAHFHMTKAGAACKPPEGGLPDEHQGTKFTAAATGDLAKAAKAAAERDAALAERDNLLKTVANIGPTMEAMAKRLEDIANTPLPAAAIAVVPNANSVTKQQDNGGGSTNPEALRAEIKKALDALPPDERVVALVRIAQGNGLGVQY